MYLIHHQQMPHKHRGPHVGVLDPNSSQQRLIDGAHRNRRGEIALGMLRSPDTRIAAVTVGCVVIIAR